MRHELKTWPLHYQALVNGTKTFEARKDDRGFEVGDTLWLREYDNAIDMYTGRAMYRCVTHLLRGPSHGIESGYVVMSLATEPRP